MCAHDVHINRWVGESGLRPRLKSDVIIGLPGGSLRR